MKTRLIVNPRSAEGKTANEWQAIEEKVAAHIDDFSTEFTTGKDSAIALTQNALAEGIEKIVAIGGDGTLSECVNGFFKNGKPINKKAIFSFVMRGRGNDFRKTVKVADDLDLAIKAAAYGSIRKIDLIKIEYTDFEGNLKDRISLNLASFGMSGDVVTRVNESNVSKFLGGMGTFLLATVQTLTSFENKKVRLVIDDTYDSEEKIRMVAIANGQYAGGGMWFAPEAQLDDGLLDVVIMGDLSMAEVVLNTPQIYNGKHFDSPKVSLYRGKKIKASSEEEVLLDIDGEAPGMLPASFEVMPSVLNIQC